MPGVNAFNVVPNFEEPPLKERAKLVADFLSSQRWEEDERNLEAFLAEEFASIEAGVKRRIVSELTGHRSRLGKRRQVWSEALGFAINRIMGW